MSEELKTILRRIGELARVTCRHDAERAWDESGMTEECDICHGSDQIPDPAYAGLVEVLTKPLDGNGITPSMTPDELFIASLKDPTCPDCGSSDRVLRLDWPQGALAGSLKQWLAEQAERARLVNDGNKYYPLRDLGNTIGQVFGMPDCNERAAKLLLEWMEAKP